MASATLRLILVGLAAGVVGATAVAVTGLAGGVRDALGLGARWPDCQSGEFTDIYFRNASLAAAATVAALPGPWRWWESPVRVVLALLFVGNAALVGAAGAAYGGRVLGPHMAVELVGFALAGGPLACRGRRPVTAPRVMGFACGSLLVLAAAAAVETAWR